MTILAKKPWVLTRRSNGVEVVLHIVNVDRQNQRVTITIPAQNASFVFGPLDGRIQPIKREPLDDNQPFINQISKSVYPRIIARVAAILSETYPASLRNSH